MLLTMPGGVNTVRSLAGPSGLYMQSTVIVVVIVMVIVYGGLDAELQHMAKPR